MAAAELGHEFESHNVEQTFRFARRLGEVLRGGEVIALIGPLGAGKTQFVKGLAAGNGHPDPSGVTSPTFTLVNEYPGRFDLYHLDAYRLRSGDELAALGFDEMTRADSVVVIEWADRVTPALPDDRVTILFESTGDTSRRLTLTVAGPTSRRLLRDATSQTP